MEEIDFGDRFGVDSTPWIPQPCIRIRKRLKGSPEGLWIAHPSLRARALPIICTILLGNYGEYPLESPQS